jgi:hypothetical protein
MAAPRSRKCPMLCCEPQCSCGSTLAASATWVSTTTSRPAAPSSCRKDAAVFRLANNMHAPIKRRRAGIPIANTQSSSADKRRGGEIGSRARGTETAQGENEEHQADAVTDKADGGGACNQRRRGPRRTESERQPHVGDSRHQTLGPCDEDRLARRDLASQVVVYRPTQACTGHGERPAGSCGLRRLAATPGRRPQPR